jgi:hypothetical protein
MDYWNIGIAEYWNSDFTIIPVFHYSNSMVKSREAFYVKFS